MSSSQSANLLSVSPTVSSTRANISDNSFLHNSIDDSDNVDIESFKEEQDNNDTILYFLLNYKCPKKRVSRNNKSNADNLS